MLIIIIISYKINSDIINHWQANIEYIVLFSLGKMKSFNIFPFLPCSISLFISLFLQTPIYDCVKYIHTHIQRMKIRVKVKNVSLFQGRQVLLGHIIIHYFEEILCIAARHCNGKNTVKVYISPLG